MDSHFRRLFIRLFITVLILIVLEVLSSALFPFMGMIRYRIPFNVLIVLYLAFKLRTSWLPVMILVIQWFHSFFSIEGWEMGTIAGVLVSLVVSYLRDLLDFSSKPITIVLTQIFQCLWVAVIAGLFALKGAEGHYLIDKLWRFIPESMIASLLAPTFFIALDKIWSSQQGGILGDEI